jgi:hypothetical protein
MRAFVVGLVAAGAAIALTGCPNPNAIGVQRTGSVAAHCQLANGQAVAGALVAVSSINTCTTGADGSCTLQQVPVGPQFVSAHAPGLDAAPQNVQVTEGNTTSVTLTMSPSNG